MKNQLAPPSVESLAMRYLRQRQDLGEITRDTAAVYGASLFDFARQLKVPVNRVKQRHVVAWLERPDLSPSYRRDRLSIARRFLQWCVLQGHLDHDPTLGLRSPKQPPKLPRHLHTDEAADLLDVAVKPRTRLAVLLMLQECLRRGEVARLQVGDVDLRRRSIDVRGKGGQGEVTRRIHLTQETYEAILDYLPSVPANTGPLLRSELDAHAGITGGQIYREVIRAMRAAGVKHFPGDGRSPHALRHTGAQDLADRGVEMRKIQKVLGHATLNMAATYVRGSVRGLDQVMEGRRYQRQDGTGLAEVG